MGEEELLGVGAALILAVTCVSTIPAQGPVYRERWGYLHLEQRRVEVLHELRGREPVVQDEVARLLAAPDDGVPFTPVAQALAHLRGVPADRAFVLRTAVSAYVLPEVCDPDATVEACRDLNVSLFLPFTLPESAPLAFAATVTGADGKELWSTLVDRETSMSDLRMARPHARVPGASLADGTYTLRVRTLVGGEPGPATAPTLSWPFHVLRGYQRRAEVALGQCATLRASADPTTCALLGGMADCVGRAYHGAAFAVASTAVVELERLERALANIAAKKPVLDGLGGELTLGLPAGTAAPLAAVLRRARADVARPLVVIAAGVPTYDLTARRPSAPSTRDPAWLAHEFAGFAAARDWNLAFLESPGGGRNYIESLLQALPALRDLLPVGGGLPLLVVERESAAVVALHLERLRPLVRGVVLVGGGVIAPPTLEKLGSLPVRYGRFVGSPAGDAMAGSVEYAAGRVGEAGFESDVGWLSTRTVAWTAALPLLAPELEAFARQLFGP